MSSSKWHVFGAPCIVVHRQWCVGDVQWQAFGNDRPWLLLIAWQPQASPVHWCMPLMLSANAPALLLCICSLFT